MLAPHCLLEELGGDVGEADAGERADHFPLADERVERRVAVEHRGLPVQLPAVEAGEPDQEGAELDGVAEAFEAGDRLGFRRG